MKILHITSWYPNLVNETEAVWIKRHIDALSATCDNSILHFEHFIEKKWKWRKFKNNNLQQYLLCSPLKSWFLIELIYFGWLFWQLVIKRKYNGFDVINFHIAYPMLTYWHYIKRWIKTPEVITEHWSAYHLSFGISKPLTRIKKIFSHRIPIIAVSEALLIDIRKFSGYKFPAYVVPNIVDATVFYHDQTQPREDFFFMVSQWKWPKRPIVIFEAFKDFVNSNSKFILQVAGYGSEYANMLKWVYDNNMNEQIQFVGLLDQYQIAKYLRRCKALLHCSEYETFSVVCAEAICCHTPVLASCVGGIPEVIVNGGILIESFNPSDWKIGMEKIVKHKFEFPKTNYFAKEVVGQRYYDVLMNCLDAVS